VMNLSIGVVGIPVTVKNSSPKRGGSGCARKSVSEDLNPTTAVDIHPENPIEKHQIAQRDFGGRPVLGHGASLSLCANQLHMRENMQ